MRIRIGLAAAALFAFLLILVLFVLVIPIPVLMRMRSVELAFLCLVLIGFLGMAIMFELSGRQRREIRERMDDMRKSFISQHEALLERLRAVESNLSAWQKEHSVTTNLINSELARFKREFDSLSDALRDYADSNRERISLEPEILDLKGDIRSKKGGPGRAVFPPPVKPPELDFDGWCRANLPLVEKVLKENKDGPASFHTIESKLREAGVMFTRAERLGESNVLAIAVDEGRLRERLVLFPALYFPLKEYSGYFEGNRQSPGKIVKPALVKRVTYGEIKTYEVERKGVLE